MSRFLLATWDGGGTIPPELGLAAELVARGHEVVVLSDDTVEQEAVAAGATFTPWQRAPQARARDFDRALIRDWEVRNPLAQVRQVGDLLFFGPAALHAADLSDAIDGTSPDVLIVDALLTGASAGAERSGLPTAAVAPNVNMLRTPGVPPMGSGLRPMHGRVGRMRDAALHRLNDVLMGTGTLNDTRRALGLEPVGSLEQSVRRADRVILLTSEAFDFPPTQPGPERRVRRHPDPARRAGAGRVDAAVAGRRPPGGAAVAEHHLHAAGGPAATAGRRARARRLPRAGDDRPGLRSRPLARVPSNVHVVESAPHGAVLPHVDLVITHGGHGTVIRALAGGVPVMVVPISRDQPDNAARVVHHGVGIKVSKRSSPEKFAAAIRRALADDALRARADDDGRAPGARPRRTEGGRGAGLLRADLRRPTRRVR